MDSTSIIYNSAYPFPVYTHLLHMLHNLNQNENNSMSHKNQAQPVLSRSSTTRAFGKELINLGSNAAEGGVAKQKIPIFSKSLSMNDKMCIEIVDEEPQKNTETLEKFDIEHERNPQCVVPYVSEIMEYVRFREVLFMSDAAYMTNIQKDINEKMRGILIDWLVDVHLKFKLVPDILFMAVNLIDRSLSQFTVTRNKLQLIGITSMFIYSKYEEIYPPELKDFAYVTDKAYTGSEILDMEGKILTSMNFNLAYTSSYRFFERYSRVCGFDEKNQCLGRYLLELCLVEYKMQKYKPSLLACAAVYLTNKLQKRESWSDTMAKNTQYTEQDLRVCAKEMCLLLQNSAKSSLQAVRRKFLAPKYFEVAKVQIDKI